MATDVTIDYTQLDLTDDGADFAAEVKNQIQAAQVDMGNRLELVSVPATATSTGVVGQIALDNTYMYMCYATNTWLRRGFNTW